MAMEAAGEEVYIFWAERGTFRWVNWKRVFSTADLLKARRGALLLLTLKRRRWLRFKYGLQGLGMVCGSVFGNLDLYLRGSHASPLVYAVDILLAFPLFAILIEWMYLRGLRRLARHTDRPPVELRVRNVEYHLFYHRLDVTAGGQEFRLTVAGWPWNVRRALALASWGQPQSTGSIQ